MIRDDFDGDNTWNVLYRNPHERLLEFVLLWSAKNHKLIDMIVPRIWQSALFTTRWLLKLTTTIERSNLQEVWEKQAVLEWSRFWKKNCQHVFCPKWFWMTLFNDLHDKRRITKSITIALVHQSKMSTRWICPLDRGYGTRDFTGTEQMKTITKRDISLCDDANLDLRCASWKHWKDERSKASISNLLRFLNTRPFSDTHCDTCNALELW